MLQISIAYQSINPGRREVPPGRLTGGQSSRAQQWHNLVDSSEKTVTFIDLCGHEKYLKTTIFGLVMESAFGLRQHSHASKMSRA